MPARVGWVSAELRTRQPNHLLLTRENQIYLLTVYAKGAKDDLTAAERDVWRKAVEAIDND